MAKPISIKTLPTLKNLLDMYEYRNEEVLVLEAVANGIDAKADKIEISLDKDGSGHYVTFLNNGPPMNKVGFENYHIISSSTKIRGEGIGFAGVGAKIFLAAWDEAEIITITGKGNHVLVSRMFRRKDDVEYESSLNNVPVKQMLGNHRLRHRYGTSYRVRISSNGFAWLTSNIEKKLQFWFNFALISKTLDLKVDGRSVKPWQPSGQKFLKNVRCKKLEIPCYFWISKEDIPEDWRHVVYSVFGKRIKSEPVDWASQIRGENSRRVCCLADVSILAQHLATNKENFKKNPHTNAIRSQVKKAFFDELSQRGLIYRHEDVLAKRNEVFNDLTRRLDKVLQSPELKFLNPFSNTRIHDVILHDDDGNTTIKKTPGRQPVASKNAGGGGGGAGVSSGDRVGSGFLEDEKGSLSGSIRPRKTRGIAIIPEDFPDDPREGWLDAGNGAVVYNVGHPFSKSVEKNSTLHDYNLTRVVIASLIRAKNDQADMDAVQAFDYFDKILHDVWL